MPETLKTLCDSVLGESGFLIPPAYINSGSPDDVQMAYIADAAAADICEKVPNVLRFRYQTTFDTSTSYDLPQTYLGIVPDTMYVDGRLEPVQFPTSAAEWAAWVASGSPQGSRVRVRIFGGFLQVIDPVPGEVLRYEAYTRWPWVDANQEPANPLEKPLSDADTCLLDRRLMITAIKWRWKKEKGLPDWEVDYNEYVRQLNTFRARDQGAQTIAFGCPDYVFPAPYTNLWVA
jgi:hypothetical protein